ncbi:cyclic nucleotide-binding domain-containing protein [Deltaproteobacteria bacterium TL4]
MKVTSLLDQYDLTKTATILRQVPFLVDLLESASKQESINFLSHCQIISLTPGETLIEKGKLSHWLYLLLQGGCFVYIDRNDGTPINHIHPYDLVGELAVVLDKPRTAFILSSYDASETLVLGIDFTLFSHPHDPRLKITTKLLVYRTIQRTIYKRLRSVTRDLSQRETLLPTEIPAMILPAPYLSATEKLSLYLQNCQEGAIALREYSDQLAQLLN